MKDIGNRYILELIYSTFFQVDEWGHYSMHDLIHDLAQDVSEGEYFRIESSEIKEIPAHSHHIYVENAILGEYVEKICKLKDLRTIIAFRSDVFSSYSLKEGDLDALFKKLRKLYVMEIEGITFDVKRVPKSLVQLRNLRYLKFKNLNLDAHPVLLYQLRFLSTWDQIPNVGRLISLQELENFNVGRLMERGFELKQLEHLKDLYGSLSIFGLNNVISKEEANRAKLSNKKGLRKLLFRWDTENGDVLRDNDAEVLDGLCPPPQIKELAIENYSGKRFPSWILDNNDNVIHLQHLDLAHCGGLEALHRISKLSDLLSLTIHSLPRLKSWVPLPLNLTQLEISNCLSLAFVVKEDLDMIMSTKGTRISQIVTFKEMMNDYMDDSPNSLMHQVLSVLLQFYYVQEMMKYGDDIEEETLSTISKDLNKCLEKMLDLICQLKDVYGEPFLPPVLESLYIESCFITDKILAGSLQGLTSLTHLKLENIITITYIPKEVLSSLTNLLNLKIHGCLLLTSIGGLSTHSTLENLHISLCPNLMTFETSLVVASCSDTIELTSSSRGRRTRSSSTLKCVELLGCMLSDDMLQGLISIEELCVWDVPTMVNPHIGHLKALRVLELRNFPNLASLRDLNKLTSLSVLKLNNCPNLASLRGLNELTNLRDLEIIGCKHLSSIPDVPPSVQSISIVRCNEEFTRSCKDPNHANWYKISQIPHKEI